jgi:DNA primase
LLNRVDIVDVVGRYVQLKKGGANFMGLCPFHNEKSPSFTVSPTKQFYHCFGCGAHGTSIGFLIEYSGMGFVDAVKDLAQNVGMVVPEGRQDLPPASAPRCPGAKHGPVRGDDARHATSTAPSCAAPDAIAYLKNRGLTGEVAARFGMGYAPAGWDSLRAFSPTTPRWRWSSRPGDRQGGRGRRPHKRYDRFRERIMFPIRNTKGQVIAFGGRVLDQRRTEILEFAGDAPISERVASCTVCSKRARRSATPVMCW